MTQVSKDVKEFSRACEHLIASVALHRPLTEEEALLVRHYCKEILEKVVPISEHENMKP
jgi:hypothetical protein